MGDDKNFHLSSGQGITHDWVAFHRLIHATGLVLYVVARLYLIIEMFSSLRSQSVEAYKTVVDKFAATWTYRWRYAGTDSSSKNERSREVDCMAQSLLLSVRNKTTEL